MASAPHDPGVVRGRVDAAGRLIAADPLLLSLQAEAGSMLGARLALPQIAAVARLTRELGVPVSRAAIAAGRTQDFDLWVRASLDGEEIALEIEGWRPRPPAAPRLDLVLASDDDGEVARDPTTGEWATDAHLRLTRVAPDLAARFKIDAGEAVGQPLTRLLKLDETDDGQLPLLDALAARTGFADQPAIPRSGEAPLLLSAEIILDSSGEFAGFAGRALPSTPSLALVQPAALAKVDALNAELDRALRTPLDRIIAAADKIVERSDGPLRTDYASYAGDIAAAGRHLLSVLHAMGDGPVSDPNRIDLVAASSEAINLLAATGEAKRIAVDVMASSRVQALGNPRGVVQIIVNILGNAIRHSPADGVVTIKIGSDATTARLSVIDHGPGIASEDQARIFDRFERLGSTAPDGTGLGLAIARRLAREMGGDITLDSTPGEGARFTLELPLAP